MKKRKITTIVILLASFCLLTEVERKVKAVSQIWVKYAEEMIEDKRSAEQAQHS